MTQLITDSKTDAVFFSYHINDFKCFSDIAAILDKNQVQYGLLPFTKDIWARDFMPVQISEDKLLQYRYNPDYLQSPQNKKYITHPGKCCRALGQKPVITRLVIDGGNVIKCPDSIIMTEKVFAENSKYARIRLINQLENLFQTELIFIPQDKKDKYGHADGMVRNIQGNRLLITNYRDTNKALRAELIKILQPKFEIEELHFDVPNPNFALNWAYINYLRVGDLLILPALGIEEDAFALQQFKDIFRITVEQVNVLSIAKKGGALNCISWNVKANQGILEYFCSANTIKQ